MSTKTNNVGRRPLWRRSVWIITSWVFLAGLDARAKLNVVATLTDLAAIAQEVGGNDVTVTSLAKGAEDSHFVDARPSFIRVLNRADVLIEGGAELELGWLPPLVRNARNAAILPGGKGHINASEGVALMDLPLGPVDRSQGDVHPAGNPHYLLDPLNAKIVAAHLTRVFSQLDPEHAAQFELNRAAFAKRIDEATARWQARLRPFAGTPVLTYHKSMDYFARRFGFEVVGQLEPKPGIEPSPTYVTSLIPSAKEKGVRLVWIEPFRPRRVPDQVARAIAAKVVVIPDKVDALPGVKTYFDVFERAVNEITQALGGAGA